MDWADAIELRDQVTQLHDEKFKAQIELGFALVKAMAMVRR